MENMAPSSIVQMPKVESLVPYCDITRSFERAKTETGFLSAISHMLMSSEWVPDTTIGVRLARWLAARDKVTIGAAPFMKARVDSYRGMLAELER